MDLINKEVIHTVFGEGKIIANINDYLTIQFGEEEKDFVFPDAFKSFLEFKNNKDTELLLPAIREKFRIKQIKNKEREELIKKERLLKLESYRLEGKSGGRGKSRRSVQETSNLAFRYNFCNGGQSSQQVGFNGVCSDKNINLNIEQEKNAWCASDESDCKKYHSGEITREELDSAFKNGDYVCYESMLFRDWKAYAGTVIRGKNKGKPKKIGRASKNSLCILTTCEPGESEETRYIFGVFLIDETFKGDNNQEGYVGANPKYKIKLSKEESDRLLFWDYYANSTNPHNVLWNSGLFRYFHNNQGAQILRDIVEIKADTEDQDLANEFYKFYCEVNRVNVDTLGELSGALKQTETAR